MKSDDRQPAQFQSNATDKLAQAKHRGRRVRSGIQSDVACRESHIPRDPQRHFRSIHGGGEQCKR